MYMGRSAPSRTTPHLPTRCWPAMAFAAPLARSVLLPARLSNLSQSWVRAPHHCMSDADVSAAGMPAPGVVREQQPSVD